MPVGRPTIYTEELATQICSRIATGESVRSIAKDDKMPNASTIHAWVLDNDSFSKQYVRAKEIGAELEAEMIEEIAWDESLDVQRAKLITDVKKWNLSKKLPKRFGDKQFVDHTTKGDKIVAVPQELHAKHRLNTTPHSTGEDSE